MFSLICQTIIEQIQPEFQDIYADEKRRIEQGQIDDVVFVQSIAENWSLNRLVKIARLRHKRWNFLSVLADAATERQSVTALNLMEQVMVSSLDAELALTVATYRRLKGDG